MKKSEKIRKRKKVGFIKTYLSGAIRAAVIALLLIVQFALVFMLALYISAGVFIYYAILAVSIFVLVGLVNKRTNSSFKIGWLILIAIIPFSGLIMYLMWGANRSNRIKRRNYEHIAYGYRFIDKDEEARKHFIASGESRENLVDYLENKHFNLYENNSFNYFAFGQDAFHAIENDLKRAERFIFIEFFIVADGVLWQRIKKILLEKAKQGVEIKFLYDDYGSMFRTSKLLWKELNDAGIETAEFNPIGKYLDKLYLNYRTHQKIVVIDGKIAYTGGFNLADEYTNEVERFGVWKDNGVRIEGPGVYGLTTTFLQMWGMTTEKDVEDYRVYRHNFDTKSEEGGFCQIISDGPANNPDNPIADSLLRLIFAAKKYLYITTPYLLLDNNIEDALIIAAESGVDVRIITPGIPDKKMIYHMTRYNYRNLLQSGIKVYEYTPGFIHAKTFISDGCGLIGSMNLDFRSLYLHYECGAYIWDKNLVNTVKNDLLATIEESHEVTYGEWKKRPLFDRIIEPFCNLFSSLA